MIIKGDFVTNSSSTNFCMYGISKDIGEFEKNKGLIMKIYLYVLAFEKRRLDFYSLSTRMFYVLLHNYLIREDFPKWFGSKLTFFDSDVYREYFVGLNIFERGKDEGITQFKQRTAKELVDFGIKLDSYQSVKKIQKAWSW